MTDDLASVEVGVTRGVVVVALAGEIDIANAASVEASINAAVDNEAPGLVLDLSRLEYLDSSGIRLVIMLHQRLGARRQQMYLVTSRDGVAERLFAMVGLDTMIATTHDVERAVDAVRAARDGLA